jgi:hypothetical protein
MSASDDCGVCALSLNVSRRGVLTLSLLAASFTYAFSSLFLLSLVMIGADRSECLPMLD